MAQRKEKKYEEEESPTPLLSSESWLTTNEVTTMMTMIWWSWLLLPAAAISHDDDVVVNGGGGGGDCGSCRTTIRRMRQTDRIGRARLRSTPQLPVPVKVTRPVAERGIKCFKLYVRRGQLMAVCAGILNYSRTGWQRMVKGASL